MARPLRIEYPGAVYHVISRGNGRQSIFIGDVDRQVWRYWATSLQNTIGYVMLFCLLKK
jgi:REP element-mobilizing transposase RayT